MDMRALTGCPNDAMLAIADISALAHWKSTQQRNGTLSFPELVRRGNSIEQHIRRYQADQPSIADSNQGPVGTSDAMFPTDEQRILATAIFRETSMLYLHTILSTPTPGTSNGMIFCCAMLTFHAFSRRPRNQFLCRCHCSSFHSIISFKYRPSVGVSHLSRGLHDQRLDPERFSQGPLQRVE